jgi:hypothetical protein
MHSEYIYQSATLRKSLGVMIAIKETTMRNAFDPFARFGPKIALLWCGLSLGVAFLATPAKFLAPSLSLPAALDVGRQTFMVCNRAEMALCAFLATLAIWAPRRDRWALAFALPAVLVLTQASWLIPALDVRVGLVLQGVTPPPSSLHLVYVMIEAFKIVWLAALGYTAWAWPASHGVGRVLSARDNTAWLQGLR